LILATNPLPKTQRPYRALSYPFDGPIRLGRYTGGTGKYKGIRGFVRVSTKFDPEKNVNLQQIEGEYWLEK
jgi:hypothetical protein